MEAEADDACRECREVQFILISRAVGGEHLGGGRRPTAESPPAPAKKGAATLMRMVSKMAVGRSGSEGWIAFELRSLFV